MPRWMRWGEVVDRITRSAQQTFGWTYRSDTFAGVIEASSVWRDIETAAEKNFSVHEVLSLCQFTMKRKIKLNKDPDSVLILIDL
jgi:hypothetical protein